MNWKRLKRYLFEAYRALYKNIEMKKSRSVIHGMFKKEVDAKARQMAVQVADPRRSVKVQPLDNGFFIVISKGKSPYYV